MNREAPAPVPTKYAPVYNRLTSLMLHSSRYSIEGITKLAEDAGVSQSAVSHLIRGERHPSYALVLRLVGALERDLGVSLDLREVVREDPNFPTPYPCQLLGCRGCSPPWFYDADDNLRPEYAGIQPGTWQAPEQSTLHHP